ncbi:hypothetical protein SUDANB95_00466 [Actinosynnema sp. ALI-1.44]
MFGARKQVEALTARVAELERRVATLSADLERARPLLAELLVGAQSPPTRVVGVADDRAGDAFRIHSTPLH